jgi:TLC domain
MASALLDTSNALLHTAKALNYAVTALPVLQSAKDAAFKAFAASFFVCRVALPPAALIAPGLLDGRAMPRTSYCITNGLLLCIYGLQLFWFSKIVRIALGGDPEGGAAADDSAPAAAEVVVRSRAADSGPRIKAA